MIGELSRFVEPAIGRFARGLRRLGLRPDHITVISFCCSLAAAFSLVVVADHSLKEVTAGTLVLLSGLFDATDGTMARLYGEESNFGAFLDSVLDRVSEIIVYSALMYSRLVDWWLGLTALSASLMVSYARARGEQLGAKMKGVGIAERPERLLILALATLLDQLNVGVLLIALLSAITVLQRIIRARSVMVNSPYQSREGRIDRRSAPDNSHVFPREHN